MQLLLKKDVIGVDIDTNVTRLHASAGDVLFVLLKGKTPNYWLCESKNFPNEEVPVFINQTEKIIMEEDDIYSEQERDIDTGDDIQNDPLIGYFDYLDDAI